jgi:HEPN domain-containing protein
MRTPEQVRWDFVQQWLDKAHKDLQAATILFNSDIGDFDNVGFHAQQAAEKFIKALLVRYQIEFPKTHSIAVLRQLIVQVDQALAERLALADALTPYGVEFRYPGDFAPAVTRSRQPDTPVGCTNAGSHSHSSTTLFECR